MRNLLLILALLLAPTPNLTTQWQGTALRVTWHAPGYHCLYLDRALLDCRNDSADLLLPLGGVDHLYAPRPGQVLRLVDAAGVVTASVVVPIHLTPRQWLPLVWVAPTPPPKPVYRVWLGWARG